MSKPNIGLMGLGVMGAALVQNIESRGFPCVVYNRSGALTDKFMQDNQGRAFVAAHSLEEFVQSIATPRQILLMIKAGDALDHIIEQLMPLVSKGDIIADMGNSFFLDTMRREERCAKDGVYFMGIGVSGGEEGALKGPSIMPGGSKEAWQKMASMLDAISAKVPEPCHAYVGPDGAGHFVKMVHNGIEYGDMQLIAEAYDLLDQVAGCKAPELHKIFVEWNEGPLSSFLIEISATIFNEKDPDSSDYLVNRILDAASQKGTGKWTAQQALDLGVPIPTMGSAVDARFLSALKSERESASKILGGPDLEPYTGDRKELIQAVHDALFCSKIVSYAQGMAMIQAASKQWNWNLKLDEIAALWRGGCIIRAQFLNEITKTYREDPNLSNLLLAPYMKQQIESRVYHWRKVVSLAAERGVPVLAFSSALSYYDSYRRGRLPQNLTQAQRDLFGAHTFERTDKAGAYHHIWGSNQA